MKTIKKNWDDKKVASKIDDSLSKFDDGELFVEQTFSENDSPCHNTMLSRFVSKVRVEPRSPFPNITHHNPKTI